MHIGSIPNLSTNWQNVNIQQKQPAESIIHGVVEQILMIFLI